MFSPTLLATRTAIVTGASRGIGLGVSRALAAAGAARLVLVARNADALAAASSSLRQAHPDTEVVVARGDVRSRAFWSELAELSEASLLVNAAGVAQAALLARASEDGVRDVLETNLVGTTWACQAYARARLRVKGGQQERGCVVNVGSLLGSKGGVGAAAYAASKAGVLGLTRALAAELGPSGMRFNAVVPGYVETDMVAGLDPKQRAAHIAATPLRRFGEPDEIAAAAVFLAANRFANNCVINLDGGLSAI